MKMGGVNMAVATAMMALVIVGSLLHTAEAQPSCLTNGEPAPFADANTVVQLLRVRSGQCCQTSSGFCTVLLESGNAAATICGATGFCASCASIGNDLNEVLAECNTSANEVEGVYSPNGSSEELFYLTDASNPP